MEKIPKILTKPDFTDSDYQNILLAANQVKKSYERASATRQALQEQFQGPRSIVFYKNTLNDELNILYASALVLICEIESVTKKSELES